MSLALKTRIARYLEACGYIHEAASDEAANYSGHSGRVGMYTAASEAGIAIEAVAALARHKSLNVAQTYARQAGPAEARAVEEPGVGRAGSGCPHGAGQPMRLWGMLRDVPARWNVQTQRSLAYSDRWPPVLTARIVSLCLRLSGRGRFGGGCKPDPFPAAGGCSGAGPRSTSDPVLPASARQRWKLYSDMPPPVIMVTTVAA